MAERKFDYENVATVYNSMKGINENIKTLLTETDTEVQNRVNVLDEALYGELGDQMLLSWNNMSSCFPEFVDNFENWAALIAKASGDYSQFEVDVAAFKNANPLGVTSAGAQYGAVTTSSYNNSFSADEIERLSTMAVFYQETGATYIDTGMVDFAKRNKVYNIVTDALSIVSIAASGVAIFKAVKAAAPVMSAAAGTAKTAALSSADELAMGMASKSAGGFAAQNLGRNVAANKILNSGFVNSAIKASQNAAMTTAWYGKFATTYAAAIAKGTVGNSAFWTSIANGAKSATVASGVAAGSGILGGISSTIGSTYDASKYGSGYDNANVSTGSTFTVGNKDYVFVGSTSTGKNVFSNDNGDIYYLDGENMVQATATDANGNSVNANFDTIGSEFTMNLGDETITQNDSLSPTILTEYTNYFDSISGSLRPDVVNSNVIADNTVENNG